MLKPVRSLTGVLMALISLIALTTMAASAQPIANPKFSILLLLNTNPGNQNTADGAVTVFSEKFSSKIGMEDSYKLSNSHENIAINRNGTLLSIEGRPVIKGNDTLPLEMWKLHQNSYFLQFKGSNFPSELTAFLKDDFLHIQTPISLASTTIIPFEITADPTSVSRSRFTIVFKQNSETLLPITFKSVKAFQKDKVVQVVWETLTEVNTSEYKIEKSINGKEYFEAANVTPKANSAIANSYNWTDVNVSSTNFYRVRAVEKSGQQTFSQVVRVNLSSIKSSITTFPNPATGNTISLQMNNIQKGRYSLNIYTMEGQTIYKQTLLHTGRSGTQYIILPTKPFNGVYNLQLSNEVEYYSATIVFN